MDDLGGGGGGGDDGGGGMLLELSKRLFADHIILVRGRLRLKVITKQNLAIQCTSSSCHELN